MRPVHIVGIHGGGEVLELVPARHHLSVGTCGTDCPQICPDPQREQPSRAPHVGGLADRTDHIIDLRLGKIRSETSREVFDFVLCTIEGWPDQIIHTCIQHKEVLGLPHLDEKHP